MKALILLPLKLYVVTLSFTENVLDLSEQFPSFKSSSLLRREAILEISKGSPEIVSIYYKLN